MVLYKRKKSGQVRRGRTIGASVARSGSGGGFTSIATHRRARLNFGKAAELRVAIRALRFLWQWRGLRLSEWCVRAKQGGPCTTHRAGLCTEHGFCVLQVVKVEELVDEVKSQRPLYGLADAVPGWGARLLPRGLLLLVEDCENGGPKLGTQLGELPAALERLLDQVLQVLYKSRALADERGAKGTQARVERRVGEFGRDGHDDDEPR